MAETGWTGLDPEMPKDNIQNFYDECMTWISDYRTKNDEFMEQLSYLWASENAVKESKNLVNMVGNFYESFLNKCHEICLNATRAYNIVAVAHGVSGISEGFADFHRNGIIPQAFSMGGMTDNINGRVGINTTMVKDILLPNFKTSFNALASRLDSLPSSIALYDDENGQQHAFVTGISQFEKEFNDLLGGIWAKIEQALENKVDNALLAKEKATQVLNG